MHNKHGIKAEITKKILTTLMGAIVAHADDGDDSNSQSHGAPINYEELIAKARKEEKDKLYDKIKSLESQNSSLITACNNHLTKIGELERENSQLKDKSSNKDSEEVKSLKEKISTLEGEKEVLQAELKKFQDNPPVDEEALKNSIREELKAEYEVKDYLREKLSESGDKILKTFADTVSGKTKEEVDESIKLAIEKSDNIRKELGLIDDEGNPKSPKGDSRTPKKTPKPKTPNPAESTSGVTYDTDYIRGLDPNSEEYREFRKQLGLK